MTLIVQDNQNKVRFDVEADNKSQAIQQAKQKAGVSDDLKIYRVCQNGTTLKKL